MAKVTLHIFLYTLVELHIFTYSTNLYVFLNVFWRFIVLSLNRVRTDKYHSHAYGHRFKNLELSPSDIVRIPYDTISHVIHVISHQYWLWNVRFVSLIDDISEHWSVRKRKLKMPHRIWIKKNSFMSFVFSFYIIKFNVIFFFLYLRKVFFCNFFFFFL